MGYDIIICSQHVVKEAYRVHATFETEWDLELKNKGQDAKKRLKFMPFLFAQVSVLILDESQDAKGPDTLYSAALRSMKPSVAVCLSGTIIFNPYENLWSQLSILPGCPFVDPDHFTTICGRGITTTQVKSDILVRFLASIVVARPKEIDSTVPEMRQVPLNFTFGDRLEIGHIIHKSVRIGKALLKQSKSTHGREAALLKSRGMAALQNARVLGASELLCSNLEDELRALDESLQKFAQKHNISAPDEGTGKVMLT
jgi:hypothetical protein